MNYDGRGDGALADMPSEEVFRGLGFTDYRSGYWFRCWWLSGCISFNVTIGKATRKWQEVVLDELSGQPYHYGRYPFSRFYMGEVERIVEQLNRAGVGIRVDHAAYGVQPEGEAA